MSAGVADEKARPFLFSALLRTESWRRQQSDRRKTRVRRLLASTVAGFISFLLATIMGVNFGMLIFSPVPGGTSVGVRMAIIGVGIAGNFVLAYRARLPCVVVTADNGVLAPIVAEVVRQLAGRIEDAEALRATAIAAVALACIGFGGVQLLLMRLKLTKFVQFLPYSIPMGFLSGIGLELCSGIALAGGPGSQVAAAVVAACLCWGSWWRGWPLSVLFPAVLLISIAAFYLLGGPKSWLLELEDGGEAEPGLAFLWNAENLRKVHWLKLARVGGPLFPVLCLLGCFQNFLFAELYANMQGMTEPVEPDEVLGDFGTAFLLGGGVGCAGGFHNMACISLSRELKSGKRAPGILVAVLSCGLCLVGLRPILTVPRFVFAGLLLWVGLKFLRAYLWQSSKMLPASETAVIVCVAGIMKVLGFAQGVMAGLVLALVGMVHKLGSLSCVQRASTVCEARSNAIRSVRAEQLLLTHGKTVLVLRLAPGFVFFATSAQLLRIVEQRLSVPIVEEAWQLQDALGVYAGEDSDGGSDSDHEADPTALRCIVIDFMLCQGFDGSFVFVLQQLGRLAARHGFDIYVAGLEQEQRDWILGSTELTSAAFFADLDHALESVEEQLLALYGLTPVKEKSRPGLAVAGVPRQLGSDAAALKAFRSSPPEEKVERRGWALLFLYSDDKAASRSLRPAVVQAMALVERHCALYEACEERCPQLAERFGPSPSLVLLREGQPQWQLPKDFCSVTGRPGNGKISRASSRSSQGVAVHAGAAEIAREVERVIHAKDARRVSFSLPRQTSSTTLALPEKGLSQTRLSAKDVVFSDDPSTCSGEASSSDVHSMEVGPKSPSSPRRRLPSTLGFEENAKLLWEGFLRLTGAPEDGPLVRLAAHVQGPRELQRGEVLFHKGAAKRGAFFIISGHVSLWIEGREDDHAEWGRRNSSCVNQNQDAHRDLSKGTSRLLRVGPGWALGETPSVGTSFRRQVAPLTCLVETEARVLSVPTELMQELWKEDSSLALALHELLSHFWLLVLQHSASSLSDLHALVFAQPSAGPQSSLVEESADCAAKRRGM